MSEPSFGSRLLTARTTRRLSQEELARRIDVSSRTVVRWEREGTRPRGATYDRLIAELPDLAETSEAERLRADVDRLLHVVDGILRQLGEQP